MKKKKPTYQELEERQQSLELLLNAVSETLLLVDPDWQILVLNETAAKRLGKTIPELMGTRALDRLPPEVAGSRKDWGDTALRTGQPVCFQDNRDGRFYDTYIYPVPDPEGRPIALAIYARDFTERMQNVQAMFESEENFRSLAENANDGILITAGAEAHVYANRRMTEITGYTISELLESKIHDLAHPEEAESIVRRFKKRIRGEGTPREYETRIIRKDGTTVKVAITASKTIWKGEPSSLVIMRDITRRSQIERNLRASEQRFRAVFEGSLDAILLSDPETGRILDANPIASELLQKEKKEIVGSHYEQIVHPAWRKLARKEYARLVREEGQTTLVEMAMVRADGAEVPVEVLAQLIQVDGIPVVQAILRDITQRRQMDKDLRDREEQFRILTEASLAGIFVFRDGKLTYVNPAFARIFGYEVSELTERMGPVDLIHPEDRERADRYLQKGLTEEEWEPSVFSFRGVNRSGNVIHCEALQAAVQYRGRRAIIGTLLDVTGLKRREEELVKTQRLESLGVLAGGIAHDFNNILTAISTNLSMARMYGNLEEDICRMMEDAEKASVRARNLTQQLLSFAKGGAPVRKGVNLDRVLMENVEFALSGSNVGCEDMAGSVQRDLWEVEADEGQIGQVIHNLILNAVQAMPEGGVIRIGAENVCAEVLKDIPLKPGRYVCIFLTDQGVGIPERHMQSIFDPFFTTKQKGSGLGLTTSYTIVKNHEGYLHVESEVGTGTTVRVYLPASDAGRAAETEARGCVPSGRGRVLLVDDEEMIRSSAGEALRRLGYDVTLAEDGAEGIRLYREALKAQRAFDAVLLDLTIPGGKGGKEAVRDLLRIDPGARVIASSGYSNDPVMARYREHGFRDVVVKPYRIKDLGRVLHKVISRPIE